MSDPVTGVPFRANAIRALSDSALRAAMRNATETFATKRAETVSAVPLEEWRDQASDLRLRVLDHLSDYVDLFERNATRAGAKVHRTEGAKEAREIIASILRGHGIAKVVKSKSMISEEIHLNDFLQKQGVKVVETDFGEYIIQIAGEGPSHIIAPAIHKDRRQVGKLFAEKLGCEYSDDPMVLAAIAKKILRKEFFSAKAGISGANFAIADSGSIVLVTNEGNGRMCTSIPPVHIAVLSIEKIVPSLSDLPKFIRLLPRSATGQILSSYMSVITGTRKPGESTGAEEMHVVLLDNGRSEIVKGEYREMLKCIRCGACLNACPVYRLVGGHAYDSTYPGPMGIVLTALLDGMERAHPLLDATTLCGACGDVCPVKVPLPRLLHSLREQRVEKGFTSRLEQMGMAGFGMVAQSSSLFNLGQAAAHLLWPIARKIGPKDSLDRIPRPVSKTFRKIVS
ncbi:MAG TPA: LutB/LldF family L-lactate oxidation iron-sulfur protein [Desulfomonilaceae bacterium]|nr:LutB/LldF family L-lactate oxidation iron-sulfur protein [Desulfomonilaceae bacterium]